MAFTFILENVKILSPSLKLYFALKVLSYSNGNSNEGVSRNITLKTILTDSGSKRCHHYTGHLYDSELHGSHARTKGTFTVCVET